MSNTSNLRLYFPVVELAIGPYCSASGLPIHGVQSVGLTTSFNLEQVFELGQLQIYENIENLPSIELTASKVLDGSVLLYHAGTRGSTSRSLSNRSNQQCDISLALFRDTQENASGYPVRVAYCSGMYTNSLSYTLPVQGNCTESVTYIGNDKIWVGPNTIWQGGSGFKFTGHFTTSADAPPSGTQRRQHVVMGNAAAGGSVWPSIIQGVTVVAGSGYNVQTAGFFGAHIQDVSISTNLGRTDLFELGRKKPYYKYANFPTPVNCTINVTAGGSDPSDTINAISDATSNLSNEPIDIRLLDGTEFYLGTKNKLSSVNFQGSTQGVFTISYQFQNFNILEISSPFDPDLL